MTLPKNRNKMSFTPPSADEIAAVERLKVNLASLYEGDKSKLTDTAYLRFLRGRKNDEEKAVRALIRFLEWRVEHDVDNISSKKHTFQDELDTEKIIVQGKDIHGHPAIFIYAAKHDKNKRDLEQLKLLIIYTLEDILLKTNPHEERIVICFDLEGFSLNCMDYEVVKLLVNILQFNYPDTLHVALIINAPFLFSACWAIIKPWLDPVTAAKAQFIRKEELMNFFPEGSIKVTSK